MKNIKCFLVLFLAVSFDSICKQYVPVEKNNKVQYASYPQKKKLFKSLDCDYSNEMEIVALEVKKIDPYKTDYYKINSFAIDELSKKYSSSVLSQTLAPMYLKWISPIVGYGVFASRDIKEGDFIGIYAGQLRLIKKVDENLDYAWYYTIDAPSGEKLVIDAKYQSNELRFINHAKDPNTKRVDIIADGIFYVCYVAQKDIAKDVQLTVSYGDGYWVSRSINPENF